MMKTWTDWFSSYLSLEMESSPKMGKQKRTSFTKILLKMLAFWWALQS